MVLTKLTRTETEIMPQLYINEKLTKHVHNVYNMANLPLVKASTLEGMSAFTEDMFTAIKELKISSEIRIKRK